MKTQATFFSWNTKVTNGQFVAVITKNVSRTEPNAEGRYVDTEVVNTAICTSRAKAVGYAKKMVRFYIANA